MTRLHSGSVAEFDEHVGLGTVTTDDGEQYPFHCTQIADGSRKIASGTVVVFTVVPRHGGRYEAYGVTPR